MDCPLRMDSSLRPIDKNIGRPLSGTSLFPSLRIVIISESERHIPFFARMNGQVVSLIPNN